MGGPQSIGERLCFSEHCTLAEGQKGLARRRLVAVISNERNDVSQSSHPGLAQTPGPLRHQFPPPAGPFEAPAPSLSPSMVEGPCWSTAKLPVQPPAWSPHQAPPRQRAVPPD